MTSTDATLWTAVICDENRRRAFFDYQAARDSAQFAEDEFIVTIARRSALPTDDGGRFVPPTAWGCSDVAHETTCPLIDDTDDELFLKVVFERAQVMAAALNAYEQMKENTR